MQDKSIVILGNGGAALYGAQAVRDAGHRGELHLISDTAECAFNPMLSPYYFKGKVSWENCFPFGADFYRDLEIVAHCGVAVGSLEAARQQVTLIDGKRISYDRCLIATGASPVLPPVPGLRESSRALPLRSAGSARQLEEAMNTARRVLIMGASLVGIEMAEVLVKRGIEVILLDVADQILPRGTHPSVAAILMKYLEDQGVDVRLGTGMLKMEETPYRVACHFADDVVEEVDLVVCSTGVRSNLDFVDRDEVDVDLGVLTDDRMQTNVENLYAAGDVSQAFNRITGQHDWLGTWGNACLQGRIAGQQIAGREACFPGSLPENISPLFEWNFAQIGDIQPTSGEVRHLTSGDPEQGGYSLLVFSDGILTGANLINCTHISGMIHGAILRKWRSESLAESASGELTEAAVEEILRECTNERLIQG
jgi:NADPH-dependent 2,4-dienoyl-CoA reductase/sulfur reductase-like enzyme